MSLADLIIFIQSWYLSTPYSAFLINIFFSYVQLGLGLIQPIIHLPRHFSRDMTKPTKWHVHPVKIQISWASAQSDQSLHCPHEKSLVP